MLVIKVATLHGVLRTSHVTELSFRKHKGGGRKRGEQRIIDLTSSIIQDRNDRLT